MDTEDSTSAPGADPPPVDRLRWLWLLIGLALATLAAGRTVVPLAAWLSPIFVMRFVRTERKLVGIVAVGLGGIAPAAVALWGMVPMAPAAFVSTLAAGSFGGALLFLADRAVSRRLPGALSTLFFPAACTAMELIGALGNPFGRTSTDCPRASAADGLTGSDP